MKRERRKNVGSVLVKCGAPVESLHSARGIHGPGQIMSCKGQGVSSENPSPCCPPTGRGMEALAEAERPPQKDGRSKQLWKTMLVISKKI